MTDKQKAKQTAWAAVQAATDMGEKAFNAEFEVAWAARKANTPDDTIASAIVNAASFGLFSALGFGHYEARFDKNSNSSPMRFQLDSQGKKEVMYRYGAKIIHACVVHEGDEFSRQPLAPVPITHIQKVWDFDENKMIGAYAFAKVGEEIIHAWIGKNKLKKLKSIGRQGLWNEWPGEMAEKSAIIQLYRIFPKTAIPGAILLMDKFDDEGENTAPAPAAARPAAALLEGLVPPPAPLPSPDELPTPAEGWNDESEEETPF